MKRRRRESPTPGTSLWGPPPWGPAPSGPPPSGPQAWGPQAWGPPPWGPPAWAGPPWARGGPPSWARPGAARAPAWLPLFVLVPMLLGSLAVADGAPHRSRFDGTGVALLVLAAVALLPRRRWPVPAFAVTTGATVAFYALGYPVGPASIALYVGAIGMLACGLRTATAAVLLAGLVVLVPIDRALGEPDLSWRELLALTAWMLVALAIAEAIRSRRERFAEMARTREEAELRHAGEERLRIARELHDVLAHNVSLINVQAGTALHLFDAEPERARAALAAIKGASHETLQELRATVGALRGTDEAAPRAPTAGLSRMDDLVAQSAAVGLHVDVRRDGAVRPLPASADLAAFRIVQEALTNVRRHSGADRASVRLSYADRALTVIVSDHGRGARATDLDSGHGLRGMRERAEALGGRLSAGPVPGGGGFTVQAVLPLAPAESPPVHAEAPERVVSS